MSREKECFQRSQKKIKKVVYEDETDSEPETEESQYVSEEETIEQRKKNNFHLNGKIKFLST